MHEKAERKKIHRRSLKKYFLLYSFNIFQYQKLLAVFNEATKKNQSRIHRTHTNTYPKQSSTNDNEDVQAISLCSYSKRVFAARRRCLAVFTICLESCMFRPM